MNMLMASVVAIFGAASHGPQHHSSSPILMECYGQSPNLVCYQVREPEVVDIMSHNPDGWSCAFSFYQGQRKKLCCKSSITGEHKLVFGDFINP